MTIGIPQEQFELPDCANADCCEACNALPTGKWGIPWRGPDGEWNCLPQPDGAGIKVLKCDENGPYWANP